MQQIIYGIPSLILFLFGMTGLEAQSLNNPGTEGISISGEQKKWHTVTLTFDGPECSETDDYNPFFNYRLNVTFNHKESGKSYTV